MNYTKINKLKQKFENLTDYRELANVEDSVKVKYNAGDEVVNVSVGNIEVTLSMEEARGLQKFLNKLLN